MNKTIKFTKKANDNKLTQSYLVPRTFISVKKERRRNVIVLVRIVQALEARDAHMGERRVVGWKVSGSARRAVNS
eukprot:3912564-Amphidinium_carterae.1